MILEVIYMLINEAAKASGLTKKSIEFLRLQIYN